MKFKSFKSLIVACALMLLPSMASAVTVNYADLGSHTGPSFSSGGITATGNGPVVVANFNGIGIGDVFIDEFETINFAFDMPATDVSYNIWVAGLGNVNGPRTIEAFGIGGVSLGTGFHEDFGTFTLASLFGDVIIESFSLTGQAGALIGLNQVSYEVSVVPLPAALPLYGAGLAVMGFFGWRRKRKATA